MNVRKECESVHTANKPLTSVCISSSTASLDPVTVMHVCSLILQGSNSELMTQLHVPRAGGSLRLALSPHGRAELPSSGTAEKVIMHPSRTVLHLLFLQLWGQTSVSGILDTLKCICCLCTQQKIKGYVLYFRKCLMLSGD